LLSREETAFARLQILDQRAPAVALDANPQQVAAVLAAAVAAGWLDAF
jgi:hypothetical protein